MSNRTKPLKVAIVGCGAVSQFYYAPALSAIADAADIQVTALFDRSADRAGAIKKFFPQASLATSLSDLTQIGPDLAIVATPPRLHAEQSCLLLSSGISVLCEKPMASRVSEAEKMIEQASASDRVLAVGLMRRFFPSTREIHRIVNSGALGAVRSFRFAESGPFAWPVQSPAIFDLATAGGGVLLDLGSHVLDLVLWWFGQPAEIDYKDDAMGGLEANCTLEMKFDRGFDGRIRLGREGPPSNSYSIEFERGRIDWSVGAVGQLQVTLSGSEVSLDGTLRKGADQAGFPHADFPEATFQQCFIEQLLNVIAAVRGEQEPVVPGEEGILSLKLIERCYSNRQLLDMPWLGENELARAKALITGR